MPLEITKATKRGVDASVWVIGSQSYSGATGTISIELWGYPTQELADARVEPMDIRMVQRAADKLFVETLNQMVKADPEWSGAEAKPEAQMDAQAK
jgi:hypothetical protein